MSFSVENTVEAWQEYVHSLPTIGEQWVEACSQRGNPVVLSDTLGTSLKAKSALTGSIILARRIKKISPENNIGMLLPTTVGGMLANIAGLLLAKTVINLNYTANVDSILSAISQASIKTVYSSSRFISKLEEQGFDTATLKEKVNLIFLEDLNTSVSSFEKASTLLICKTAPTAILKKLFCFKHSINKTAVILFSSGSEGAPKGVMLSHANIITNLKQILTLLKINDSDVFLANLPLFHAFGLTVTFLLPLLERVPVICHPDPTDVYTCSKIIEQNQVSLLFGTSSFYRLYIRNNKVNASMLKSLRLVIAGAEKLQKEVAQEFKVKFNKIIYEGYGATETSPVSTVNIPDELNINELSVSQKTTSAGLPLPGTQIKIVDPDSYNELPINQAGMILVSGGQVMQGYLDNPEKTAQVLRTIDNRDWYATGDKGYLDEDGFLFIQDRYTRFAKIGGEMVGLGSVEEAIREVMQDSELEVIAINLPHKKKGEQIVVLSTQILDSSILRTQLSQAGLNTLALPSMYIKVDQIPYLGSGKTDFASAKDLAIKIIH